MKNQVDWMDSRSRRRVLLLPMGIGRRREDCLRRVAYLVPGTQGLVVQDVRTITMRDTREKGGQVWELEKAKALRASRARLVNVRRMFGRQ